MDLLKLSIKRPIFITMVTLLLITLGFIALKKLPIDLYPSVSYPTLAVRSSLPGAAPEEIEQLITKRLEDVLSTISGIKTLRSVSREGNSVIILEFDTSIDIKFQEIQVRAKVANARSRLPETMEEPIVQRQDPDDTPIIELAVTGKRSTLELSKLADRVIANRLRQIAGVGEVSLNGERLEEVRVDLHYDKLLALNLSPKSVVQAISKFNRNDPVGTSEGTEQVWLIRSVSQAKSILDLQKIPVLQIADGNTVYLKDIADVEMSVRKVQKVYRFGKAGYSEASVGLEILKQSGENTLEVSDRLKGAIAELQKFLPDDIEIKTIRDNSTLIRQNVDDVYESLVIGSILTVLVVLLFLQSPRSTLTTGLSLPCSVITTFAVMSAFGFTVNVMTLLALSLAIGLLVDDAIVVRENIFRHIVRNKGKNPQDTAYKGAREVALAVIGTTLTIVAVFLPVAYMGGITGQFFTQFALTIVFSVLVSLWDALTMAPMLSAYFANIPDPLREWQKFGGIGTWIYRRLVRFEHGFTVLEQWYERGLTWVLPRPWVALLAALLCGASILGGAAIVKKSFLPSQLGQTFELALNGPLAQSMPKIDNIAHMVEDKISGLESIDYYTVSAGRSFSGSSNIRFTIGIKDSWNTSQTKLDQVRQSARKLVEGIPGFSIRISEPSDPLFGGSGPGRFQPVSVLVVGEEIDKIKDLAREVRVAMLEVPGIQDIPPIDESGLPEIHLTPKPTYASMFQLTASDISDELRIWVDGDISNYYKDGDNQIPIRVKMKHGDELTPRALLAMQIKAPSTSTRKDVEVPLSTVVKLNAGSGPNLIIRESRQRLLRVGATITQKAALGDVVRGVEEKISQIPLPSGYSLRVAGQNEQMQELFQNIAIALGLGSLFVYMILAALFESFLQPLTVMAAIPLAATGAFLALIVFGLPLDLYSGIGLILLAGIVAKNSILLVDFAMQRVRDGHQPFDAIKESAPLRLRPILMTSIAMIAGMIPVALGLGASGSTRMGLGVATIGGVISSTLLTLVIVPNLFIFVCKMQRLKKYLPFSGQ